MKELMNEISKWDIDWHLYTFNNLVQVDKGDSVTLYKQRLVKMFDNAIPIQTVNQTEEVCKKLLDFYDDYVLYTNIRNIQQVLSNFDVDKETINNSPYQFISLLKFLMSIHNICEVKYEYANKIYLQCQDILGVEHPMISLIHKDLKATNRQRDENGRKCTIKYTKAKSITSKIDATLARGVKCIGEVLGCGTTKAQAIINAGFLTKYDVGYKLGRTPILEIAKWNALSAALKSQIVQRK